jgi:outer membrane protein, multidrug efflux system
MRKSVYRFGVSLAAMSMLGACASMTAPKVSPPNAWVGATATDAGFGMPDPFWWQRFQSTELNRLITEAVANNFDLKVATARVLQVEASATVAGAALLPSISGGAGANRSVRQIQGGPDTTSTGYSASLQTSYQLDLFGRVRNSAASAVKHLESSLYDRETATITLISNVITTYLQVLSARERYRLTSDRLGNAETIFKLLETQRRVGTLSELELAQQRAALANQRASLPALKLAETQSLNALAVLLGLNPQGFMIEAYSLSDLSLPVVEAGIPSTLMVRRPDLRSAEASLKAANFDVAAARAARFPSISLTASGGTSSGALESLFTTGTFLYSLAGSASQSIFDAGRLKAQEQGSRASYLQVAANYQKAVISAFSDVENALAAVNHNDQQYRLIQEAATQADLAYRLAELRYRAGAIDFQTVLNAQNSAFSSQESLVQSRLSRFTAVISLTAALGGGWGDTIPEAPPMSLVLNPL